MKSLRYIWSFNNSRRLTPDNKLVILEANPNPDIAYGEEVAEAAERGGISYEQLIDRILRTALRRYAWER